MITAGDFRNGVTFEEDGNVLQVVEFQHVKPGKGAAFVRTKTKNVITGAVIEKSYNPSAKFETAFRDYGNTVFRVLQLTGFVTINYDGILLLSPNENRIDFYNSLKNKSFAITESAKESEDEYFEQIGYFDAEMEQFVQSFREKEIFSTNEYNAKIPNIISSYNLNKDSIEQALVKISSGETKGKDCFWFIQDPVKFEFLLTLFVYSYYGDKFIYKPNYICDESGIPYSHAPGNIGDIEIYNKEKYWLIEATLIRAKTQQVNNETVNLFRHIDTQRKGSKYLTLVAPYIHDDTKMIFNVATVITLMQNRQMQLSSVPQTTSDFVDTIKHNNYFANTDNKTRLFIDELKNVLEQKTD